MFLVPLVGLFDQQLVKLFLACSPKKNALKALKAPTPVPACRDERSAPRFREAERHPASVSWSRGGNQAALWCFQSLELMLEPGDSLVVYSECCLLP